MREEIKVDTTSIVVDPCNKAGESSRVIAQMCGVLPEWFILHCKNPNRALVPIKDWMTECYRMGNLFEMNQATNVEDPNGSIIHPDLSHTYPGDPIMYPLVHITAEEGVAEMVQWEAGIVAFRDKPEDKWFLTRMD